MRYVGIDYGTKRIGLALSDEEGMMAYPHSVINVDGNIAQTLADFVDQEKVDEIVFGQSLDQKGNENKLMKKARDLIGQLSLLTHIPIHLEQETFSSAEASRLEGFGGHEKRNPSNLRGRTKSKEHIDDSAAALILQRFLDKKSQQNKEN